MAGPEARPFALMLCSAGARTLATVVCFGDVAPLKQASALHAHWPFGQSYFVPRWAWRQDPKRRARKTRASPKTGYSHWFLEFTFEVQHLPDGAKSLSRKAPRPAAGLLEVKNGGRALGECGQAALEPVHISTGLPCGRGTSSVALTL
jgi:hypothetical protein